MRAHERITHISLFPIFEINNNTHIFARERII
jgi:hypothetical protein